MKPDLVYQVRRGANEELRYSLRSVDKNVPHGSIWMFGDPPEWVQGVNRIDVKQLPVRNAGEHMNKWKNAKRMKQLFHLFEGISDPFVLMNDDFFAMKPIEGYPLYHLGPSLNITNMRKYRGDTSPWLDGMLHMERKLKALGYKTPINTFEAHVPFIIEKEMARKTIEFLEKDCGGNPLAYSQFRTAYAYVNGIADEGIHIHDPKVERKLQSLPKEAPWWSTSDVTFGDVGRFLQFTFDEPSRYERTDNGDESRQQEEG